MVWCQWFGLWSQLSHVPFSRKLVEISTKPSSGMGRVINSFDICFRYSFSGAAIFYCSILQHEFWNKHLQFTDAWVYFLLTRRFFSIFDTINEFSLNKIGSRSKIVILSFYRSSKLSGSKELTQVKIKWVLYVFYVAPKRTFKNQVLIAFENLNVWW